MNNTELALGGTSDTSGGFSMEQPMNIHELMQKAEGNFAIFDGYAKAYSVLSRHENIACSISGGSDSDIILDICARLDPEKKIRYVWFNTGMEYAATKRHLDDLEQKYGITIERIPAIKSIPTCCREYGQPFLSKLVSQYIEALQAKGFQWEDEPYEVLMEKYPHSRSYIGWWCNKHKFHSYNIRNNPYLKEFLIAHPPTFRISNKCCTYAKKKVGQKFDKENGSDLQIVGIRKAEGGVRAGIKTCFTPGDGVDTYRPIFWYKDEDKRAYERLFGVSHSDCYEVWGLKRTGCVGCPFNRKLGEELSIIQQYEPKLYKAACHVFRDSYEYTKQYREFVKKMKAQNRRPRDD